MPDLVRRKQNRRYYRKHRQRLLDRQRMRRGIRQDADRLQTYVEATGSNFCPTCSESPCIRLPQDLYEQVERVCRVLRVPFDIDSSGSTPDQVLDLIERFLSKVELLSFQKEK